MFAFHVVRLYDLFQRESWGEVSEWPKEQRWKRCVRFFRTAGSNPALSATNPQKGP